MEKIIAIKYFDSYLVGLTATPKDEVDRNTYSLFQRKNQDPTFAFGLEEAIDQFGEDSFKHGIGAEAVQEILSKIDLEAEIKNLVEEPI